MVQYKGRIAAATVSTLGAAIKSGSPLVILLDADLDLCMNDEFRSAVRVKPIYLHADLMKGIAADREGLRFLARTVGVHGVVSTRSHIVRLAKSVGLACVQRTFLIDTQSLESSIETIAKNPPDAVEFMPALAAPIIPELKERLDLPIILAGLLRSEEDVRRAFDSGADAVSMSRSELWPAPGAAGR